MLRASCLVMKLSLDASERKFSLFSQLGIYYKFPLMSNIHIKTSPWVKSYHLGLNPASHYDFAHIFRGLSASHFVKVVGV